MVRRWAAGLLPLFVLVPSACTDAPRPEAIVSVTSSSSSPPSTTTTTSSTTTSTTVLETTTTTTTTIAPPSSSPPAPADVEELIRSEFGELGDEALSVAWCESRYLPDAVNGPSRGLFQIHEVHAEQWLEVIGRSYWSTWSDPVANAAFAHWLYGDSGGWGPWSCKP